ncbi:lipopolysaccharide biosynthesis protein [Ekhidna sp.]|uniref:lipopolysaccharide biosynthesis protein n=1 Tax=Ekhidna sp. TaxID=2608089 RepID=UPI003B501444
MRKLRDIINNDIYLKNFLTLFSGTAIVQILPFFTAPITARIYEPADYGYTAMYTAVASLFTLLISSHYVHFIILSKRKKDVINVMVLTLIIGIIVTTVLTAIILLLKEDFISKILNKEYAFFLYLLPLSVFIGGYGGVIGTWNNKLGKYKLMATIRLIDALFSIVIVIVIGILVDGPYGLFIAIIFGPLISISISTFYFFKDDSSYLKLISFRWLWVLLKREKKYALFIFPSDLINKYINLLPLFVIENLGGKSSLGSYQFSQRILGMPINFIGSSILEVFRKKAIDDYHENGNCLTTFRKTFSILSVLSIIPTLILMIWAPEIFQFVFGDKWYGAGRLTQALSVLYFFKMVSSPLSYMYYIAKKTKEDLITQIALVLLNLLALALGFFYFEDVFMMVLLYSLSYSAIYVVQLVRSYHFAKGKN